VAKRVGGRALGACQKMRINRGQEFVIGGYMLAGKTFYAMIFRYYEGDTSREPGMASHPHCGSSYSSRSVGRRFPSALS
jgi:hypothetical protein